MLYIVTETGMPACLPKHAEYVNNDSPQKCSSYISTSASSGYENLTVLMASSRP